jgi:hypothetical protein
MVREAVPGVPFFHIYCIFSRYRTVKKGTLVTVPLNERKRI